MNIIEDIVKKYNQFKAEHGCEPMYARVKTHQNGDTVQTVKLSWDNSKPIEEEQDYKLVDCYAEGVLGLCAITAPSSTCSNFVVKEVLCFQAPYQFLEGTIGWVIIFDWATEDDSDVEILDDTFFTDYCEAVLRFNEVVDRKRKKSWIGDITQSQIAGGEYFVEETKGDFTRTFEAYKNGWYLSKHTRIEIKRLEMKFKKHC